MGNRLTLAERIQRAGKENIEHGVTISVAGYTRDTWEANGGTFYIRCNAAVDIYDIRFVLTRTHKSRN